MREPYTLTAMNFPGGPAATVLYDGSLGTGYITWITYRIFDQPPMNTTISLNNVLPLVELLNTLSNPFNASFYPPDGQPLAVTFNTDAQVLDALQAAKSGGLPIGFTASRSQALYVNGLSFLPQQQQTYGPTYGIISVQTLLY